CCGLAGRRVECDSPSPEGFRHCPGSAWAARALRTASIALALRRSIGLLAPDHNRWRRWRRWRLLAAQTGEATASATCRSRGGGIVGDNRHCLDDEVLLTERPHVACDPVDEHAHL